VFIKKLPEWHGVPRENIELHQTVEPGLCIGCGLQIFRFDYGADKPIVTEPNKCKVGCVTCANTCPTHAIGFPPLNTVHKIMKEAGVIQHSRKEMEERKEEFSV